jgi:UDP-N-acetylglucosamine--N-acetylmuramyl-(pentapeptide) pyrophosphoryl-undecaprenol N-acetylglucosamine transferase
VLVPLPWAAENHQWFNAGLAQEQGWAIRIAQDSATGPNVEKAMEKILSDKNRYDGMRARALKNSPAQAAAIIVGTVAGELGL